MVVRSFSAHANDPLVNYLESKEMFPVPRGGLSHFEVQKTLSFACLAL